MPRSPNLVLALAVTVALFLSFVVMALGAVLSRLRKIARPLEDTARMVDDLAQRQRAMESLLDSIGPASRPAPGGPGRPARPPSPTRRVDRAAPDAGPAAPLIAVPNLAASASNMTSAMAELGRRFGAIWAMADLGASGEEIARETGYPIGQIELILGLRRQSSPAADPPGSGRT